MKRFWLLCLLCITATQIVFASSSANQLQDTAPTLVPPTLVPVQDTGISDALASESAIARIQRDAKVRVGLLYNVPPFGELNLRGEVSGFDADLARSMAETWGVQAQFIQVTRQTAIDMLRMGQVDILIAAQTHRRELDAHVEFSQTYYFGSQAMMVREGDAAASLADMANRRIGLAVGNSSSQDAIAAWQSRSNLTVTTQTYLTLDQAYVALVNNEIDGVVDNRVRLTQVISQPGVARILDDPVAPEPYAVAVRRQDIGMRNLVNRTLQYLVQNGRMNEIHQAHFLGASFPTLNVPLWAELGEDAPTPGQFAPDIQYPTQYIIPRMQEQGIIRVAGIGTVAEDAPESERRLNALNRAIIEAMVSRWGVQAEFIPDSAANALDLVATGQADLAVGVTPDWTWTDRVDFTNPYLLHGDRLMVREADEITGFNDLRGKWVAIFASEPGAADRVNALAESINTRVEIFTIVREQDAAFHILVETNADVVYGDSLKLIPHVQANPDLLRLVTREEREDPWYNRSYTAFAVPRNDIDFRLLVEYTLQELALDGTLAALLQPVMLPEDIPTFDVWPGSSLYLGFNLG
jgi:polar amino acid transport system substrate-binding protein